MLPVSLARLDFQFPPTYAKSNRYAEVLENTQFALIATVHKLYAMVRSGQQWDLGEPELNDRGQPVIHDISSKLGCIRPNSDIDLPVHSVFPEDEAGLAELSRQLEEQQADMEMHSGKETYESNKTEGESAASDQTDRASSSELDHSDYEQEIRDYRKEAFGGNPMTLSPQSFTSYNEFESVPTEMDPSVMFPPQTAALPTYSAWTMRRPTSLEITPDFLRHTGLTNVDMLSQGLLESEFGTLKPHVLSCPNPEVMMGMGDPMIYSGYDGESMRL